MGENIREFSSKIREVQMWATGLLAAGWSEELMVVAMMGGRYVNLEELRECRWKPEVIGRGSERILKFFENGEIEELHPENLFGTMAAMICIERPRIEKEKDGYPPANRILVCPGFEEENGVRKFNLKSSVIYEVDCQQLGDLKVILEEYFNKETSD